MLLQTLTFLYFRNYNKIFCISDDLLATDKAVFEARMKKRANDLLRNCKLISQRGNSPIYNARIPILLKAHSHHLCKVPKCGSTYWTQAFLAMAGFVKVDHFEKINRETIHGSLQEKVILRNWRPKSRDILMLVTRNPWHRIYSAYMDKIFRLQTSFIHNAQVMLGERGEYSGKIPTFQQFLKYIISNYKKGHDLDPHWMPISNLCRVCRYKYTYVLQMESFVEDSSFVLGEVLPNHFNSSATLYSILSDKHSVDEVGKLARQFTSEHREKSRYVSFIDTMKRLWVSLQSQGLISDDTVFNADLFENLSYRNESKIVEIFDSKHNEKILSSIEKRNQRQKHFRDAYAAVDKKILQGIEEVYQNDFFLFSYKRKITV